MKISFKTRLIQTKTHPRLLEKFIGIPINFRLDMKKGQSEGKINEISKGFRNEFDMIKKQIQREMSDLSTSLTEMKELQKNLAKVEKRMASNETTIQIGFSAVFITLVVSVMGMIFFHKPS